VDEAELLEDALGRGILREGHGHDARQPHPGDRVAYQRRRRLGGDAAAPRCARQPIRELDIVAFWHAEQRGDSVEGPVVLALDEPPPERSVVGRDALPHAGDDLLRRAAATSDMAHHLLVAVEGYEHGLVGGREAAQPQATCLEHGGRR